MQDQKKRDVKESMRFHEMWQPPPTPTPPRLLGVPKDRKYAARERSKRTKKKKTGQGGLADSSPRRRQCTWCDF